jgi:hypothetical protein
MPRSPGPLPLADPSQYSAIPNPGSIQKSTGAVQSYTDPKNGKSYTETTAYDAELGEAYVVSPYRWAMLFWMMALNILNNVVCYSFSPVGHFAYEALGKDANLGYLTSAFFLVNLVCSYHGAQLVDTKGLRYGLLLGSVLQAAGCWIRWGGVLMADKSLHFPLVLLGQTVAALSQPFITNTPPALSTAWFPDDEVALATSLAVGANQVGIAVSYICATQVRTLPATAAASTPPSACTPHSGRTATPHTLHPARGRPPSRSPLAAPSLRYPSRPHTHTNPAPPPPRHLCTL